MRVEPKLLNNDFAPISKKKGKRGNIYTSMNAASGAISAVLLPMSIFKLYILHFVISTDDDVSNDPGWLVVELLKLGDE